MRRLSGTRALVVGAETAAGRALAVALADAGARCAVVAASPEATAAFEVQRLSRRIGATSQAIDAGNEMAVRVMTRQVAKALGGLDLLAFSADLGQKTAEALALAARFAAREMSRSGGRAGPGTVVVVLRPGLAAQLAADWQPPGVDVVVLEPPAEPDEAWAREAVARLVSAHGERVEP